MKYLHHLLALTTFTLLLPGSALAQYQWANFAGLAEKGKGDADGTGSAARFNLPRGVAVDDSGNVYVADTDNHTIRKITSAGVVTTLAGAAPSTGSTDGTGSAARFKSPSGAAVDGIGNVYVADTDNHTIRKIASAGVVTTLAGTAPSTGSTDGTGSAARFKSPYGAAVDGNGNIYVADTGNHTIRKITSAGVATTLAGTAGASGSANGTGSAARFNFPYGVTVDGSGNVYVADSFNYTIRKITSAGVVTTLAGTAGTSGSANGMGSTARFNFPYGVTVDGSGNVYVGDTNNCTIRKITPSGFVSTLAGTAGVWGSNNGFGSGARFDGPCGVAVDGSGNVYVADSWNSTIRKITPSGEVTTLAGTAYNFDSTDGTGSAARFNRPTGVAVDASGNVYVADTQNYTIRKITPAGVVTTLGGTAGVSGAADGQSGNALFSTANGIAVNTFGMFFVADTANHRITRGAIPSVPTVSGPTGVSVTTTTATLGGNVRSDGAVTITERGVVYSRTSTNANPLLGGTGVTAVIVGSGTTGVFTVPVNGLTAATGYRFKAYATNMLGTSYSGLSAFTTQTLFAAWATANGVSTNPAALGGANLLAFASGHPPRGSGPLVYTGTFAGSGAITSTGQPITLMEGADTRAVFVRRKDHVAAGLTYTVKFSADLSTWEDSTAAPTVLADDGVNQIVSVPYPALVVGQAPKFFQVRVDMTP